MTRRYFIMIEGFGVMPLTIVDNAQLDALEEIEFKSIPTLINAFATRVWPEPDQQYEIFTLQYRGTVGP